MYHINLTDKCNLNCKHCYATKNSITMNEETIENMIEFLYNKINIDSKYNRDKIIEFIGGEVGILDPNLIINIINKLKDKVKSNDLSFKLTTNLCYKLTDDHIKLFKMIDNLCTSYDYKIRFSKKEQEELWFNNIDILNKNSIKFLCIISLTKTLITEVSPENFISILKSIKTDYYNLNLLSKPINNRLDYDKPLNRDMNNWVFEVYKLCKKNNINIEMFNMYKDSINGKIYSDFERDCQTTRLTINPNGDVSQCPFTSSKPFYNINSKKLNIDNFNYWKNLEDYVRNECKVCEYYKYCRGQCCLCEWDESGCPTCKDIFKDLLNE